MEPTAGNSSATFTDHTSYRYHQLDRDSDEIRLVRVLPGRFDDALQLEIEHVPLLAFEPVADGRLSFAKLLKTVPEPWKMFKTIEGRYIFYNTDTELTQWEHPDPCVPAHLYQSAVVFGQRPSSGPHYEALSYAWGTDTSLNEVTVLPVPHFDASRNDPSSTRTMPIRQSLFEALKHLRYADKPRTLWIDALSINQHDLTERSIEVKRMGMIFKLATQVVVWLGCATADGSSQHALKILSYIGQQVEYSTAIAFLRAPGAKEQSWHDYDIPLPYSKEDYSAIQEILDRPWWRRLWVWQEILLADSHAIFQCGSDLISWPFLRHAVLNIRSREREPGPSFWDTIHAPYNLAKSHGHVSVLDLIFSTRKALYTTPQDRIYALFGFMDPKFVETIQPDYTLPIKDVFKGLCISISQFYRHLKYLEYCDIAQDTIEDMPSWVPNWSDSFKYKKLDAGFASGNSACGDSFHVAGTQLHIKGVMCGVVENLSTYLLSDGHHKTILQSWETEFAPRKIDKELFVLTLLADSIEERWPERGNSPKEDIVGLYHSYLAGGDVGFFATQIVRYIKGRVLFQTDGYFGLAPASAKIGDVLCVVLGCGHPLLLRPCKDDSYQVIGPVYIYDLMNGEALLGPLPSGWTVHYTVDENGLEVQKFGYESTEKITSEDPRLGPLPSPWEVIDNHGSAHVTIFRSRKTGKEQRHDPRLTADELKQRGVDVQQIVLK